MKKKLSRKMSCFISMIAALTLAVPSVGLAAEEKAISQEELEELKQELQKEIDEYGTADYEEVLVEELADSGLAEDAGMTWEAGTLSEASSQGALAENNAQEFFNTEEYASITEKGFTRVSTDPLSTFAADVDTGSYCNLRRMIREGYSLQDIPSGAIRTEELLNYFDYVVDEEHLSDGKFSVQYETTLCPWNEENQLLLMTVQANEEDRDNAGNNFVLLLDTSGSMDYAEKIALAKCSFKLLCYTLTENDRVSIVTYSGDSYTALDSCPGDDYEQICSALDSILPYGGTNGSGGIQAAYDLARKNYIEGGNNRIFIASDGDMNLGITDTSGLVDLITEEKESGIFLSVLGFGTGNYSDLNMESIADAGNGNYFYIDCLDEAQHVLIENQKQTSLTVAKDVKFQAEFNPGMVSEYRLIGYENRDVADDDFLNDAVDGGEVGAGAQVTILYELVPADGENTSSDLKYQGSRSLTRAAESDDLLTLSVNYKDPEDESSQTEEYVVKENDLGRSVDMNLAISLAELSSAIHNGAGDEELEQISEFAGKCDESGNIYRMGYQMMVESLSNL